MDSITKQFLFKVAAEFRGKLLNPDYKELAPEEMSRRTSYDIQNYGHLQASSPEYAQAMKDNNFSPEYMDGLSSMGRRVLEGADDSKFVDELQSGKSPDFSRFYQGIDPVQAAGGYIPALNYAYRHGGLEPIRAAAAGTKGVAKGVWGGAKGLAGSVVRGQPAGVVLANGIIAAAPGVTGAAGDMQRSIIDPEFLKKLQSGALKGVDLNSPLVRAAKTRAATTYANNAIEKFTGGWGGFGKNLKGFLQFLLSMGVKIPGYGALTNKLVDWSGATGKAQTALDAFRQKQGSAYTPYSHYTAVHTPCGAEVLFPWNLR